MGDIVQFTIKSGPTQNICGDCGGALFHWYDGFLVCVQCLAEYDASDAMPENPH